MTKNNKCRLAIVCACIALGGTVGCSKNNGASAGDGQTTRIELNIVRESVELELFEEYDLQYNYTGEKKLSWSVEDPSVVTVSEGKLVALKKGETTVCVQVGNVSDVCEVKVNGVKSELLNVVLNETQISLYKDETYTLAPTVVYGEKTLTEGIFAYESSDSAVVSVSASGVLTANSVGEANIFVTATALETTVGSLVNVSVNTSGKISINTIQSELYVLAEYEGQTYKNETQLEAIVTEKGVQKNDATVVWTSSDESVATVKNGKVVAVGVGNAEITATYEDEDGQSVKSVSFVTVLPVTHTLQTTVDVIKTRTFALDEIQTGVTSAYVTDGILEISVPISSGTLDFSGIGLVGQTTLVLSKGNVLIHCPAYLWTDGISDLDGLVALRTATDGHYRLETDLSLADIAWQYETPVVFKGVFDGGEHTLTDFAPVDCGLFYELGNGAKVQNLNFKNATLTSENTAVGCLTASVAANATVTVDNVTGNIINNGNACGGLFGRVGKNANVTLQSSKLHVYAANAATNGGALAGCADGMIVMPDSAASVIYTNINLCGSKAYEGFENSASESINQFKAVKPNAYGKLLNVYDVLTGDVKVSLSEKNIAKATLFANTAIEVTYDNGFMLPEEQAQGFVGNNFEVMLEKADGTLAYYAIALEYGELKLTNGNKQFLKYAQGGSIVLQEDIDLGGEVWTTRASFAGVLDGNGYAIKNLTTSNNDSSYYGLFLNIAGEVKNIAFINVKLGNNSGVLAGRATANLVLNDVLIQVTKTSAGRASATVERSPIEGVTINLTDVVIAMPKTIQHEYIYGYQVRGFSSLTNVHCIGLSDGAYSQTGANYVALNKSTVTFHSDKVAFNLALDKTDSEISLGEASQGFVEKYFALNIVEIGQSNVSDMLTLKGDEYVRLTEDVDLAGIEWNGSVTFSGTLDGNGYAIKNLATQSRNGFFKDVTNATIKNVAFVNVALAQSSGAITYQPTGRFTVENTFIQVASTTAGGRVGAICERSNNNAVALNLTNVVIVMPNTNSNEAIYGYVLKGLSSLTNVHCIGLPNENASVHNEGALMVKGSYTLHTDLGTFNGAEKSLTTFLTDCVANYLNK